MNSTWSRFGIGYRKKVFSATRTNKQDHEQRIRVMLRETSTAQCEASDE